MVKPQRNMSVRYWNEKKKYCSFECRNNAYVGRQSPMAGKKHTEESINKMSRTWFRKGEKSWNTGTIGSMPIAWNKGLKFPYKPNLKIRGENNYGWKGDAVGYSALHKWVKRWLGKPKECENCKITINNPVKIHWANRSGNYLRDLTDWLRLCAGCHKRYDLKLLSVCP